VSPHDRQVVTQYVVQQQVPHARIAQRGVSIELKSLFLTWPERAEFRRFVWIMEPAF
jgi:hypothetical protein